MGFKTPLPFFIKLPQTKRKLQSQQSQNNVKLYISNQTK